MPSHNPGRYLKPLKEPPLDQFSLSLLQDAGEVENVWAPNDSRPLAENTRMEDFWLEFADDLWIHVVACGEDWIVEDEIDEASDVVREEILHEKVLGAYMPASNEGHWEWKQHTRWLEGKANEH